MRRFVVGAFAVLMCASSSAVLSADVRTDFHRMLRLWRTGKLDLEGITLDGEGGFWLASEGDTAKLVPHALLHVNAAGEIEEEVEIRHWRVSTRQGERRFQTRLDDWPLELPGGGFLIRDVAGDLYRVADAASLDTRSRALLWAFVD